MTLRLTKLDMGLPITAGGDGPNQQFLKLYNKAMTNLEEAFNGLETAQAEIAAAQADLATQLASITAVTKRDKRAASYTSPTAILTASDAGASATITVASHDRIYSDASTLAIIGAPIAGLAYSTTYTVYYDDTTLADTTPNFVASTNIADGAVGAADGRHALGVITTPAAAGPPVTGGGAYSPGYTVGGEIP
jgi:hypothetical protein